MSPTKALQHLRYGQQIDLNPQVACQKPTLKAPREKENKRGQIRAWCKSSFSWLFRWRWMQDRQKGEQRLWLVHGASHPFLSRLVASSAPEYFFPLALFVERQHGTIVHSFQKATARA